MIYYVKNKKLVKKDITAVNLIDSLDKDSAIKLLASSFNDNLDKVDGWSKKNPRRNFVVLEFDSSNLDEVKQVVKADFESAFNYILLKTDDKGIFILDLNEDIGKSGYKVFVKELAKNLGITANSKMTSLTHLVDINGITKDNIVSATTDKEGFDLKTMASLGCDVTTLDPKNNISDKNKGKKAVLTTYYTLGRSHKILSAEMSATEVVKANDGQTIRLIGNSFKDEDGKDVPASKNIKDIDKYDIRKSFIAIKFNSRNYQQNIAEALEDYCLKHGNGRYMIVNATSTQDMLIMDLAKAIDSSADYENVVLHFANDFDMKASAIMRNEDSIVAFDYNEDNVVYDEGSKPFLITSDLVKRPNPSLGSGFSRSQEQRITSLKGYGRWFKLENSEFIIMDIRKTHDFPKSMNDLFDRLENCGKAYRIAHESDKNIGTTYVIDVLGKLELWCRPYVKPNNDDVDSEPALFFDWDRNIYRINPSVVNEMIMAVDESITSSRVKGDYQQSIGDRRFAKKMQYTIIRNHDLIALNNGVYDLKVNKFMSYDDVSPIDYCFTRKSGVNYIEGLLDKTKEPVYEPNNWSISKWFTQIATDKNGKVNSKKRYVLYQIILGALMGYCWGKTSVFLLDKNIGGTSKSTYLQLIKNILTSSGYASINLVQICSKQSASYLYNAVGKSAILGDEMDFSDKRTVIKNSAPFKNLADNGEVLIHKYYKNPYPMSLNCLFIQAANVFPTFTDSSDSVFDRIYPVMFNHKFNAKKDVIIKNMIKTNIARKDVLEYLVAYILKNVRIDHGFVDTGENIKVDEEQQAKQNSLVAFKEDYLETLKVQCLPVKTWFNMYHNYVAGNRFDQSQELNIKRFIDQVEQKTHWYKTTTRERVPLVKVKAPNGSKGKITIVDKVSGQSISINANETIWSYVLGGKPVRKEASNHTVVIKSRAEDTESELASNGLNKYFDQTRGFKESGDLFDPFYIEETTTTGVNTTSNSESEYQNKWYLANIYENAIFPLEKGAHNVSNGSVGNYKVPNPGMMRWKTTWLVNKDIQDECKRQLNRYLRFLKAALYLYSFIGNTSGAPFMVTGHDIDSILISLPLMVKTYFAKYHTNDALNKILRDYGDVLTPYVYTLPEFIKDKGEKSVKANLKMFFDAQAKNEK